MEDLTGLLSVTTPKPGCPGWRVDDEGREWYSDAWLDLKGWPWPKDPGCRWEGNDDVICRCQDHE